MSLKTLPKAMHDRARFVHQYGRPPHDDFELDVARALKLLGGNN